METQHKLNLIRLALHLLRNESGGYIKHGKLKVKFRMQDFFIGINEETLEAWHCDTSCCAIGDWMLLNDITGREAVSVPLSDFGVEFESLLGGHLFGGGNGNCVKAFAVRSLQVLNEEEISGLIYDRVQETELTKSELIKLLTNKRRALQAQTKR